MLYVFAGFPGKGRRADGSQSLHAGGLQHCVEKVENLAILEHDPNIQYRKEGVFILTREGAEKLHDVQYRLSAQCLREGITWGWFPESWSFGNGVTIHKTSANPHYKTVVHGTDLNLDQFLSRYGMIRLAELELERLHVRHEGWEKYEARWLPGTCPQESHAVHLTWLVTTHRLPEFAYRRIEDLVENGAIPECLERYSIEPGHHFSAIRRWDVQPSVHAGGLR